LTQKWCRKNLFKFIDREVWPTNSPDLNPLDYYYWNAVVTRLSKNKHFLSIDEFKEEIEKAINDVLINEIKKAVKCFTSRVRQVEENNGRTLLK